MTAPSVVSPVESPAPVSAIVTPSGITRRRSSLGSVLSARSKDRVKNLAFTKPKPPGNQRPKSVGARKSVGKVKTSWSTPDKSVDDVRKGLRAKRSRTYERAAAWDGLNEMHPEKLNSAMDASVDQIYDRSGRESNIKWLENPLFREEAEHGGYDENRPFSSGKRDSLVEIDHSCTDDDIKDALAGGRISSIKATEKPTSTTKMRAGRKARRWSDLGGSSWKASDTIAGNSESRPKGNGKFIADLVAAKMSNGDHQRHHHANFHNVRHHNSDHHHHDQSPRPP